MLENDSDAMEFAQAGGHVSLTEWAELTPWQRVALRAAAMTVRRSQAVNIAEALQGKLTAEQRYQSDMQRLEVAVRGVAGG